MNKIRNIVKTMVEMNQEDFEMFEKNISNFKYMISIDMGCGNTSAAVFQKMDNIGWNYKNNEQIQWNYKFMNSAGKWEKIISLGIPTIIGYDDEENPVIGPEALQYGGAIENFKEVPTKEALNKTFKDVGSRESVSLRQLWKDYFSAVFKIILERIKIKTEYTDISKENVIFVVAHPSSTVWKDYIESYKNLIVNGTGLEKHQVITISEAKASMQFVYREKGWKLKWENGVIIIDLGASTIDIEYRVCGHEPKEYSINMAGKEVDILLGLAILSEIYPTEIQNTMQNLSNGKLQLPDSEFFENHSELQTTDTFFAHKMRTLKEELSLLEDGKSLRYEYYKNGEKTYVALDKPFLENILDEKKFKFSCKNPNITKFMNGDGKSKQVVEGTWYESLEKLVAFVVKEVFNLTNTTSLDKIIVTGGTANLVGIENHIKAGIREAGWIGNIPIEVLNKRTDYARTVPWGSAAYLLNIINKINKMEIFPGLLQEALKEDLVESSAKILRDSLAPVAIDKVQKVLDWWGVSLLDDTSASENSLKQKIKKIQIEQEDIEQVLDSAIVDIKKLIKPEKLPKSLEIIEKFLKELTENGTYKYGHTIVVPTVKITLDVKAIKDIIIQSFENLSMFDFIHSFWGGVRYVFTSYDAPVSPTIRQNLRDEFEEKNTIKKDLLEPMKQVFQSEFDKTEGFGMVDGDGGFIDKIRLDIDQALCIS